MNKHAITSEVGCYRYMRKKELLTIVPFSHATLWRMIKAGKFVRPVKLSARISAWNREAVIDWLRELEAQA